VEIFVAEGVLVRSLNPADVSAVAHTYRRAYVDSPHEMTAVEAREELRATWSGEYGQLLETASFGAWLDDELIGAILTVLDPPWDDVPPGPFILDLFITPEHRRIGLGRALVQTVRASLSAPITLRVDDSALQARALYLSLGFA
jgi:GNAT superfamily N-acetyltransferase